MKLTPPWGKPKDFTFNLFDPFNYLNVDNDVWSFRPVPEPSTVVLILFAWLGLAATRAVLRFGRDTAHQ